MADPEKDLEINVENLNKEFRRIPALLYRYSKEKADLQSDLEEAEAELKELKADLYLGLLGEGKSTEKEKSSKIELDSKVKELYKEISGLKRDLETTRGFLESLKAKKDMLIQLGADARKE